MSRSLTLGRPFGIELRIHVSWLAVYAFATFGVGAAMRTIGAPVPLVLGALAALALFACVVAHELAHAFVARRCGVRTRAITLFLFGGVAELECEPFTPRDDAAVAIAGPLASAALAGLSFGTLWLVERTVAGPLGDGLTALAAYLAVANGVLAVFNLIPAYPTDGGRILRALVWGRTRSISRGTMVAARVGFGFAVVLGLTGVALAAHFGVPSYAWYVLVALFLGMQSWRQARDAAAAMAGAAASAPTAQAAA